MTSDDKRILRLYKKQMTGGKSVAARAADWVMLRLSGFFVLYMFFMFAFKRLILSAILALLTVVVASVFIRRWQDKRLEKYVDERLEQVKVELILERFVLMDSDSYDALIRRMLTHAGYDGVSGGNGRFTGEKDGKTYEIVAFDCHPSDKTGFTPVLRALRRAKNDAVALLSPAGFTDEARLFIERTGRNVHAVSQDKFLELARMTGLAIDDDAARAAAREALLKTMISAAALKDAVVARTKSRAYLMCGVIAAVWTFVAGFSPLYPALALVCFALAIASRRKSEEAQEGR